jgi:hypothetical protein
MRRIWSVFCCFITLSALAEEDFSFSSIGHDFSSGYSGDGTCVGNAVYGSACLSSFVETSGDIANYYPFDFGFSNVSYALNNYSSMLD